tara:strand:- start:8516 stop:9742 length:1227 start_codon:yes stop_codon:yes gene_type:complete
MKIKKPDIVMIGLGYIGLPTAALLASNGYNVLGVDTNNKVVKTVNKGKIHIIEPQLDKAVKYAVEKGLLKADLKAAEADIYLIVVPTPFKGNYQPDISHIESATKAITPLLKKNDLYIIESTSPVGTTEKMKELIYNIRPDLENQIHIAYCPERVLPGNVMHELVYNDRVIGGIDKKSTNKAIEFYKTYVKGELHPTDSKTAEMCKLVENSSRDVQIAFANELSMICDKANIDVWELINLANKHPRVNILKPGCGVGGHCIAVDPYFIIYDFEENTKIIADARKVNNYKSLWCIEKIKNEAINFENNNFGKPSIAFMGLAFKPNIDDFRESPAKNIVDSFTKNFNIEKYYIVEPNLNNHKEYDLINYETAIREADIIVFLVAHNEFLNINIPKSKIVIDFCGITKYNK